MTTLKGIPDLFWERRFQRKSEDVPNIPIPGCEASGASIPVVLES